MEEKDRQQLWLISMEHHLSSIVLPESQIPSYLSVTKPNERAYGYLYNLRATRRN